MLKDTFIVLPEPIKSLMLFNPLWKTFQFETALYLKETRIEIEPYHCYLILTIFCIFN